MDVLTLTAPVELQAAAPDGSKPARISILAYSGGQMNVVGYGTVAIELAGLAMPDVVPLLGDHDSTLNGAAGSGRPRIEGGRLFVEGTLATTVIAEHIKQLSRDGVPLQASVGVQPADTAFLRSGESATVNGRTVKAGSRGITVVKAGHLREVSITPLGADPGTVVSIAARKDKSMSTDIENVETPVVDPVEAERERIRCIRAVCGQGDLRQDPAYVEELRSIEARAVDEGWDVETARKAAVNALRASRPSLQGFGGRNGGRPLGTNRDILAASCMLLGGHGAAIVKAFRDGERLANSVERPSGWPELCATALRMEGLDVPRDRQEMVRAAFSTTSLPHAVGSSVAKVALDVFVEMSANWLGIARIVNATDFKAGKAVRLAAASAFEPIPPGGEIKHGSLSEDAYDYQLGTYGKMFGIDRQTLINDDASILSDLPTVLGAEAARSISDLFFATLTAGASAFFTSGRGNLLEAGSNLDVGSLGDMVKTLRTQTDADGRIIGFVPTVLLVPAALEQTARALLNSAMLQRDQSADSQPMGNPLSGLNLQLAVEPRLDASSEATYYLFSQPRHGAILVATLGGRLGPVVESMDQPANMLGIQWRAYMDYGVNLAEYRAAVKATGAAPG